MIAPSAQRERERGECEVKEGELCEKRRERQDLDGVGEGEPVFERETDEDRRASVKELCTLLGRASAAVRLPHLDADHDAIDRKVLQSGDGKQKARDRAIVSDGATQRAMF